MAERTGASRGSKLRRRSSNGRWQLIKKCCNGVHSTDNQQYCQYSRDATVPAKVKLKSRLIQVLQVGVDEAYQLWGYGHPWSEIGNELYILSPINYLCCWNKVLPMGHFIYISLPMQWLSIKLARYKGFNSKKNHSNSTILWFKRLIYHWLWLSIKRTKIINLLCNLP